MNREIVITLGRRSAGARTSNQPRPDLAGDQSIRHELVARVRAQIDAGVYDSPAKLEVVTDRLAAILDLMA